MEKTIKHSIFSFTTGKVKMAKFIFLLTSVIFFCSSASFADEVKFVATAKTTVRVGGQIQLQYKINAEGTGFKGPKISNFQILTGPHTSSNSNVEIINNQVSRTIS